VGSAESSLATLRPLSLGMRAAGRGLSGNGASPGDSTSPALAAPRHSIAGGPPPLGHRSGIANPGLRTATQGPSGTLRPPATQSRHRCATARPGAGRHGWVTACHA